MHLADAQWQRSPQIDHCLKMPAQADHRWKTRWPASCSAASSRIWAAAHGSCAPATSPSSQGLSHLGCRSALPSVHVCATNLLEQSRLAWLHLGDSHMMQELPRQTNGGALPHRCPIWLKKSTEGLLLFRPLLSGNDAPLVSSWYCNLLGMMSVPSPMPRARDWLIWSFRTTNNPQAPFSPQSYC